MTAPMIRRSDLVIPEGYPVGGKPSKGTPRDGRLAANSKTSAPDTRTPQQKARASMVGRGPAPKVAPKGGRRA